MLAKPLNVSFILEKSDKINIDRIRIGVAKYVVATTIFVQNSRREKKNFVATKKKSSREKNVLTRLALKYLKSF